MSAFSSSGVHGLLVEWRPSLRAACVDDFATAACLALSYRTEVGSDWVGGKCVPSAKPAADCPKPNPSTELSFSAISDARPVIS